MHGPAVSAQPIEDLPFLARKAVGQILEYPGKLAGLRLRLADGEPDFVSEDIIPVERGILFLQKLFQRGLDAFKIMEIFQQTASFPPTGTYGRAEFLLQQFQKRLIHFGVFRLSAKGGQTRYDFSQSCMELLYIYRKYGGRRPAVEPGMKIGLYESRRLDL